MAAKSDKVVITCAITGSIHTPTMSEALPVTPDQIAQQAIAAAEAGAARTDLLHETGELERGEEAVDRRVSIFATSMRPQSERSSCGPDASRACGTPTSALSVPWLQP